MTPPPAADGPTRTLPDGPRALRLAPDPAQLRPRLVAAALFLLAGFATFLGSVALGPDTGRYPHQPTLFATAVAAAAVLLATAGLLERWATAPPWALRLATAVIVLAPSAFFLVLKRSELEFAAARGVAAPGTTAWLLPMFTYAVFVPTTLGRAAAVLGGLVVLPFLLLLWEVWTVPAVAAVYTAGAVGRVAGGLALGWVASVYAVAVMGRLREQVGLTGRVGPYKLVRKLGAGGMGEVYLAEHQMLKRPCAVKLIRPGRRHDPAVVGRFEREVQAMARLGHWNTVEVYDFGQAADGTLYYAMEHLRGLDLRTLVARHGPLPPGRIVYLLRQACEALAEAHALGLVHRDVTPANLFAAVRGGVPDVLKVLDFGLVKVFAGDQPGPDLSAERLLVGTPHYLPPELARRDAVPTPAADLYAVGAVGYWLATGKPPFPGPDTVDVLVRASRDPVPPPSGLRPDLPADLEGVLLRCLEKAPGDRFADAGELAAALTACGCVGDWCPRRAGDWWREKLTA